MLPEWTQAWLNSPWLPWVICVGVMADAIIGVGFFVYGEIFFILAGLMLAGDTGISLLIGVWLSGWLGDLISYQMGNSFGKPLLYSTLGRSKKLRTQSFKAMKRIKAQGHWAVFFARFMGPISWVTPFLAGVSKVAPGKFALLSLLGVMLASAQFIAVGYMLGHGLNFYDEILAYIKTYPMPVVFGVSAVFASLFLIAKTIKKPERKLHKLFAQLGMLWVFGFAVMNYGYFFISSAHSATPVASVISADINNLTALKNLDLRAYAGDPKFNRGQPINLLMVTSQPLAELHKQIGWVQNETFSGNSISFLRYLRLVIHGRPPVSDLYFKGAPQNYAFQELKNSSLMRREHIRWWHAGTIANGRNIYLGAVSLDTDIDIKPYKGIVTLLHDIDPAVDQSRNRFLNAIKQAIPQAQIKNEAIGTVITKPTRKQDYWSDGEVTVLNLS